jgi:hypothetical protein
MRSISARERPQSSAGLSGRPDILKLLTRSTLDIPNNRVSVGATEPSTANSYLASTFGSEAPVVASYDPNKPQEHRLPKRPIPNPPRRRHLDYTLLGGDLLSGLGAEPEEPGEEDWCTLGFGASEEITKPKPNDEATFAHFGLTAGHCYPKNGEVNREGLENGKPAELTIGAVRRRIYNEPLQDGEAIRLDRGVSIPKSVYLSSQRSPVAVKGSEAFVPGTTLCVSGSFWGYNCGVATQPFVEYPEEKPPTWLVETIAITTHGDSGGPVWDQATGKAVGLIEGGYAYTGPTWFTPLEPVALPDGTTQPGLRAELDAPGGRII